MARSVRHNFRIYDHGPIALVQLMERKPGEPPVVEWRYQIHRWVWVNDELVEQPEGAREWLYVPGEWNAWEPANAERERLEDLWRKTFVDGLPPVVEQETIERKWACPKCGTGLVANPPKWSGEIPITCTCGQLQYIEAHQVSIDAPPRKKPGR